MKQAFTLASVKAWLSSPKIFGWPLLLMAFAWPILTGFGSSYPAGDYLPISVHLFDLIGATFTAVGLLLVRLLLDRKHVTKVQPVFTVVVWILIAAGAAATQILISLSVGAVSNSFIVGAPILAATTFGQLMFFTLVIGSSRDLANAATELAKTRKSLNFMTANLASELARQQELLRQNVNQILEPLIHNLLGQIKKTANQNELASRLRESIDQVVRPLSHSIADAGAGVPVTIADELSAIRREITRVPLRERYSQQVTIRTAFNVVLFSTASAVFVLLGIAALFGFNGGFVPAFLGLASVICGMLILRKLVAETSIPAGWFLPISLFSGAAAGLIFVWVNSATGQVADEEFISFSGLNVAMLQIISAYITVQQEIRWRHLELAANQNYTLQTYVTSLRQELWLSRQRLAKAVHGKTQSKLQAAVLRLQISELDAAGIQEISAAVSQALDDLLESSDSQVSLRESLEELQSVWRGVCEITIDAPQELFERIELDQAVVGCLDELIREAVSNAVKHSNSDEVDVRISQRTVGALDVEIRNSLAAGQTLLPATPLGYGSRIYKEATSSWSLTDDGQDVILSARLPLRP